MSLLRFGGKDPEGNARGVNVDSEGNLAPDYFAIGAYQALYHEMFPDPLFRAFLADEYGIKSLSDAVNHGKGETTGFPFRQTEGLPIRDYTGLELMVNTTRDIAIHDTEIITFPRIDNLTKLRFIRIEGLAAGNIESVGDFRYMSDLESIRMRNNNLFSIGDISDLPINFLELGGNNLDQIDVTNFTDITRLDIQRNNLESMGSVSGLSSVNRIQAQENNLSGDIGDTSALVSVNSLLRFFDNNFSQEDLENIIDGLHSIRGALGDQNVSIELEGNPGSSGAADSRDTEISDLISAGCSVSI